MSATSLVFKTELCISLDHGSQTDLSLAVTYDYHPGSPGSRDEPATDDTVEITDLVLTHHDVFQVTVPPWLRLLVEADTNLADSLVENARDEASNEAAQALEMRAEAAREDRADRARWCGGTYGGYERD